MKLSVSAAILPAARPKSILLPEGKGLPQFGRERRGDLCRCQGLHIPEAAPGKEQKLYKRLLALTTTRH